MAAYAALVSLLNTVDQINSLSQKMENYHPLCSLVYDAKQVESLGEKIRFFLDFIEAGDRSRGGEAEVDLEAKITSAAYAVEDEIEALVVDLIEAAPHSRIWEKPPMISLLDLETPLEEMDCIKEKVIEFKRENESKPAHAMHATLSSRPQIHTDHDEKSELDDEVKEKIGSNVVQPLMDSTSSRPLKSPTNTSTMIGLDDELIQLMEILVGWESSRKIIPIQGMGGIGKTTLARNTYEHPTIVNHFDMQAWATVSQTYTTETILSEILKPCRSSSSDCNMEHLGDKLHKILWGRRYLVILDDVWSAEALESILFFFPDNDNGSRIVVTTRLSNMGAHFGSWCLEMNLLDEDKSWNLLRETTFGKEVCPPPELEEIGKYIANQCQGLPLSITVIGRLLGESSMTQEYWLHVADDINSILNSGDEGNILSLSYTHLPAHLKPCFLYMGIFTEDHVINVSRLIKLWVAEGFLKPNESQSLEETAESHVMELEGRNLILGLKWDIISGKLKSCIIHDLLRDLCLRIAGKENFLRVVNKFGDISQQDMARDRRLVINNSALGVDFNFLQSASLARRRHNAFLAGRRRRLGIDDSARGVYFNFLQSACRSLFHGSRSPRCKFRFLRVLDGDGSADDVGNALRESFNIRYLAFTGNPYEEEDHQSCPFMFMLWPNLQTLIYRDGKFLAHLWRWYSMSQLRHLVGRVIHLPDPSRYPDEDGFALPNLQTLKTVRNMRLSEEVCKRIPNVRILGLRYSPKFKGGCGSLGYLCRLDKLQRLSLNLWKAHIDLFRNLRLPSSLQKLTLRNCELVGWEDLAVIGSLPNLQVLKLKEFSRNGYEWNPVEGQFPGLKYLRMDLCELTRWNADSCHFPVLEKLDMNGLSELEEIPLGIGEIPTLRLIRLLGCSGPCAISALDIVEEQESLGNESLQVRIRVWHRRPKEFLETLEEKVGSLQSNLNNVRLELVGQDEKILTVGDVRGFGSGLSCSSSQYSD